ncbi:hypothetical protein SAMN04488128_1021603 [Chitinophaga eiseniae]|uniref:Uncharacterized protein n=1 Tax=Chitinophaga eiseniae TaxID=634771 RepID=A0A1T4S069_9BACT|nr:hypothetical protein [Chitinophaga eiseniae]SKA21191.1 hypothetical protein SAMN04488128_1021603 [Chitinophaga eiseniae]
MRYSNGLYLSVPTPCGENWDQMTNTAAGKHCDSCAKTVIDFSFMTDAEIFAVISNSRGKICGHFQDNQLNRRINPPVSPRKNFLPALLLTAGLITGIANHSYAEARDLEQVEILLAPLPEDTLTKPMKTYDLPAIEVVAVPATVCRMWTGTAVVVEAKELRPRGRYFTDQVYPTDEERRQVKKKRWF